MRYLLFCIAFVSSVHAVTCTEGLLMFFKDLYGLYLGESEAVLDSLYAKEIINDKLPSRNYYFDIMGRKQFKALPYRVVF